MYSLYKLYKLWKLLPKQVPRKIGKLYPQVEKGSDGLGEDSYWPALQRRGMP